MKNRGFYLFLGLLLCVFCINAQPTPASLKASDYSDADILALMKQAQEKGLSQGQVEQLALAQGMASSEVEAFKSRVAQLQTPTETNTTSSDAGSKITTDNQERATQTPTETPTNTPPVEVFGQALYANGNLDIYERSLDAKAPANYEIGIGDELGISLFGNSYYNQVCVVDNRGRIDLGRNLGTVYVKGVTFENAKKLIRSALSSTTNLSGSQLEVSLAYSRSIVVHLVGEVVNPGSYKIPALNTVFNALMAAGGPNNTGSLRQIEVRRNGVVVHRFDTYAFLTDPSNAVYLQDNDYVLVKPMGSVVSLEGAVLKPGKYELNPGEGMAELLQYAGGPGANAYLPIVFVQRYENKSQRVYTYNYDSLSRTNTKLLFQNGDRVFVQENLSEAENQVSILGPVYFPGQYAIETGDKVEDLITKAGGLKPEVFSARGFLLRRFEDETVSYLPIDISAIEPNYTLQRRDQLLLFAQDQYTDQFQVSINGEVREPGAFEFKEGMTLGDLVVLSGGLAIGAEIERVEIARSNLFTPSYQPGEEYKTEILVLSVNNNPTENNAAWNTPLLPQDIVSVRKVPNYESQKTVQVLGEVKYPGTYVLLDKYTRVQDIIDQAGGLTPYAFPEGAQFRRPDAPGGYFVFDLPKALKNKRSEYNYRLEDGDRLIVPQVIDFVSVYGSALQFNEYNQEQRNVINTPYISGKRAGYYVRHYGNGYAPNAWRGKTYVVEQNGRIRKSLNLYLLHFSPKVKKGAEVYVLSKEAKEKTTKEKLEKIPTDWEAVISNITTKLTGLATLWALLQP